MSRLVKVQTDSPLRVARLPDGGGTFFSPSQMVVMMPGRHSGAQLTKRAINNARILGLMLSGGHYNGSHGGKQWQTLETLETMEMVVEYEMLADFFFCTKERYNDIQQSSAVVVLI